MSIVTISRGSYSRGKEVAEEVARALGYECISRDILIEASRQFNIPEIKLVRALHDAPSVLERFTYGKERYIAFIRAAILKHVQKGNVVYHGLAGQFFLQGIPHVLKVRIIADMEDRVREEMKRENISREEASRVLLKDDEERRQWGLRLYGRDPWDSRHYDMVLHVQTMKVADAVKMVLEALKLDCYKTTPASQRIVDNLALAANVEAVLVEERPVKQVTAADGIVTVVAAGSVCLSDDVTERITRLAGSVAGVKKVNVNICGPEMLTD